MRLMFSRLRRGVAMFIYPEMGVEARLKAARGQNARRISQAPQPFVAPEVLSDLFAGRRHRRVERCKEILKVIHLVEQGRMAQEPELTLDHGAERLAVLIFGEASDDRH